MWGMMRGASVVAVALAPWIASLLAFIFFLPLELLRWMLPGLAFLSERQQILEESEKDASEDMDIDDWIDGSDPDFSGSEPHPASDIFSVTPLEGHATFFPEIAFLTMLGGPWHQRLPMIEGF